MPTDVITLGMSDIHHEDVAIASVSGSGPWTVTLTAAVPATIVVGDALHDENDDKFLITGISGSDLTVEDRFAIGTAPDDTTGEQAFITRGYTGSTPTNSWEAGISDTTYPNASTLAKGEGYNDGNTAFDESATINASASNVTSITLTVAEGERHDGTAGTGARIVASAARTLTLDTATPTTVDWLEFNGGGFASTFVFAATASTHIVNHLLFHTASGLTAQAISMTGNPLAAHEFNLLNLVLYNTERSSGSAATAGVLVTTNNTGRVKRLLNLTVHDIRNTNGNAIARAIASSSSTGLNIQNVIATDPSSSFGTPLCFELAGTPATEDYNASSDATAGGANSLTGIDPALQYVGTSPVDLHVKDAAADIYLTGTYLSDTPAGVDLAMPETGHPNGYDRGADSASSIGAFQGVFGGLTEEGTLTLAIEQDIAAAGLASAFGSVALGTDHAVTLTGAAAVQRAIDVSVELDLAAGAVHTTVAALTLGLEQAIDLSGGSSFQGEIELDHELAGAFAGARIVPGVLALALEQAAAFAARADAGGALTLTQALGVLCLADAVAQAGLPLSCLHSITFAGSEVTGLVTPEDRRVTVRLKLRTVKVDAEDRTVEVRCGRRVVTE